MFIKPLIDAVIDNSVFFAPFFGVIPALIWLWFWLKEDIHPEPNKFIIFTFLSGMLAVLMALPLQKLFLNWFSSGQYLFLVFLLWASIEEILKFLAGFIGGIHSKADDEPIDPVIYMIVASLGFVALENTLFLIDPIGQGSFSTVFITGGLRFIGATLLHVMSSSVVGIFLSLSFYKSNLWKKVYGLFGIIIAIILHTAFNILIIREIFDNIFLLFGFVWISVIALMLVFEKIKNSDKTIFAK